MSYSPFPSSSPSPRPPGPGTDAPPTCEVPHFAPVRVRGGRYQAHRLLRHRRRAVAVGLAVTAAALVAAGPYPSGDVRGGQDDRRARGHPVTGQDARHPGPHLVSAPVRIADGEAVRLLRPGDRVDVVAARAGGAGGDVGGNMAGDVARDTAGNVAGDLGGDASVVARGARVAEVPRAPDAAGEDGTLVVLSVPRATAARLVGAGTLARLAVVLW